MSHLLVLNCCGARQIQTTFHGMPPGLLCHASFRCVPCIHDTACHSAGSLAEGPGDPHRVWWLTAQPRAGTHLMSCCCCCSSVAMLVSCSAVAAAVSLAFTPALLVTGLPPPDCSDLCICSTCQDIRVQDWLEVRVIPALLVGGTCRGCESRRIVWTVSPLA